MGLGKRGQVTIFVILGILIVGSILGFIILRSGDRGNVLAPGNLGPRDSVIACVEDSVRESVEKMLENGGEIVPSQVIVYDNHNWNYLCYQADYYQACYNLHPMLEAQIESQIELDTSVDVQTCFNLMREDFEGRDYDVSGGATEYSIDLLPGSVMVNLNKDIEISGETGSSAFSDFSFEFISPIYDLVRVARLISNDESQFCNFEYNGFMLLYPEYDIRRIDYQDSKIYRVIDRASEAEFKFAVRSCAFAPGV